MYVCCPMGLRMSAFVAALVSNLNAQILDGSSITGASLLLACLLFVSRNFSSIIICKPKTKGCDTFVSGLWLTILILND